MGLFDTFIFESAIPCATCGKPIRSTQSKNFGSTLDTYRVGDNIRDCDIKLGIVKEHLYCDSCSGSEALDKNEVWLVVWHGVYAGASSSYEAAEACLHAVDRSTLLEWHTRQQSEKEEWRRRFHAFYAAVDEWHRYQQTADKDAFLKQPLAFIRSNLGEHIKLEDPLGAILNDFRRDNDITEVDGAELSS